VKSIEPANTFLRVFLARNPTDGLPYLCKYANRREYDAEWLPVFKLLVEDSEALLDQIADRKEFERDAKTDRSLINSLVDEIRYGTKPGKNARGHLASAIGSIDLDATLSFDSQKSAMNLKLTYPDEMTTDQLILVILGWAIKADSWKSLRRCKEPRCEKPYFVDKITRGRRPQRYCCSVHGANHRARVRRGSE
jgi:hypothetical protein